MFYEKEILQINIENLKGTILVLGDNDSGKTTFSLELFDKLKNCAFLDLDVGQSSIGLPSTQTVKYKNFYKYWFIGSFSPVKNFLNFVIGAKRLSDFAIKSGANTIIVDTTGFIDDRYGATLLKHSLFEILTPTLVIAFQKDKELEKILFPYEKACRFEVKHFNVSKKIQIKNREFRKRIKIKKIKNYFKNSKTIKIDTENFSKIGYFNYYENQLIGFLDENGFLESMGIIKELKEEFLIVMISNDIEKSKMIRTSNILFDNSFNYTILESV